MPGNHADHPEWPKRMEILDAAHSLLLPHARIHGFLLAEDTENNEFVFLDGTEVKIRVSPAKIIEKSEQGSQYRTEIGKEIHRYSPRRISEMALADG